jgi:hypothetical protein
MVIFSVFTEEEAVFRLIFSAGNADEFLVIISLQGSLMTSRAVGDRLDGRMIQYIN